MLKGAFGRDAYREFPKSAYFKQFYAGLASIYIDQVN